MNAKPEIFAQIGRILPPDDPEQDPRPPAFTDEALALDFARQHVEDLRYVAAWSKWFVWDGMCWLLDDTLKHYNLARAICRAASAGCNNKKVASALASAKTVAAVVSLARSDRRLAATIDQWDADPWLLNTPGGVVDLHTGKARPHRTTDYMTKITAAAPGGGRIARSSPRSVADFPSRPA